MKIYSIKFVLFLFLLPLLYGCSGMSFDPNDSSKWLAKYYSNPTGAEIYVAGEYVGTAPISFSYPGIGVSSKKVVAKFPSGGEQEVTSGFYTFEILFDFINNKAKIKEYPTALSLTARTREVTFEKSESKSIIEAVINNDIPSVNKFVEINSDIEGQSENGITSLFVAVETEQAEVAKVLLQNGASPNTYSSDGRFPLIIATANQDEELVEMLLENGADPNMTNKHDVSSLMFATGKTSIEILNNLIDHGADLNHKSKLGHTPLMTAVLANNINMVQALVSKGAKLDIVETQHGTTPFAQASFKKHYEIAEYLLRNGADRDIPGYNGVTVRQHALNTSDNRLLAITNFNSAIITLEKIETDFDGEFDKYQNCKEEHLKTKNEYERKELKFLTELNNKQLELYSIYTDNYNSNTTNIAKVLLSFRKFSDSLDNKKKEEFVILYAEKQQLDADADLLNKMDQNLVDRKKVISDLKEEIAEADNKATVEERQARELAYRNQQQVIAAQNAQATQRAQNTIGMLSILTSGLNTYNSIQTQKYNTQAAAYRQMSDQYSADRRNTALVNSIKGIEDSITRSRRGLY